MDSLHIFTQGKNLMAIAVVACRYLNV